MRRPPRHVIPGLPALSRHTGSWAIGHCCRVVGLVVPAGLRLGYREGGPAPPWGPSQGESWASSQGPSVSGLVQRTQASPDTCLGLSALASSGLCRVQCCLVSGFLDAGHLQVNVLLQGFPVTCRKTAAPGGGGRELGSPPHEAWGVTVCRGSTQSTALALLLVLIAPSGTGPAGPVTLHQQGMSCLLEQRPPPPRVTVTPQGPTVQLS